MTTLAYDLRARDDADASLLLVHGVGDSRQTWAEAFVEHSFERYNLLAVDLPGFGESPPLRPFTFEACVNLLLELVEELLPEPIVALGHSVGGAVVTLLTERLDRVRAVIIVEANVTTATDDSITGCAALARAQGTFETWFRDFRDAIRGAAAEESMRRYQGSLDRCDPNSFAELSTELVRYSQLDGLGRRFADLDVAKLYVAGEYVPQRALDFLDREGLPLLKFPGAGHAIMVEQPTAFYAALNNWIRERRVPIQLHERSQLPQ